MHNTSRASAETPKLEPPPIPTQGPSAAAGGATGRGLSARGRTAVPPPAGFYAPTTSAIF